MHGKSLDNIFDKRGYFTTDGGFYPSVLLSFTNDLLGFMSI
ncbi:hypothetical protein AO377_1800 [Moraxella catarrhalis]|nr:hypothetical protein AO377_1800 [Moraxella catarrhalis]OAV14165.1 hypothetical protein AO375_1280 [Moraxella catarrhalis]OAV14548.1 hypothetical protein AO376_1138 [Moraxella catarrhalis]OAV16337.1 hypothetical protein AO374_1824 [Moraxella catarrhalis]